MTQLKHESAPTQFVQSGGVRLAYRRFGRRGDVPLLLLNYLAANMDHWDPKVTNGLAADHDVILVDYPGIGASSGETPTTVTDFLKACVAFCRALDLPRVDVVGYSLGGMIAQQLALEYPNMVRRIVLLATGPRGGEGMVFTDLSPDDLADVESSTLKALFSPSAASQAAGHALLERMKLRVADLDTPVTKKASTAQLTALREWGAVPKTDRFATLQNIRQPTLIVHGSKDIVVMPINAFLLVEHLPNALLIVYPDSSHAPHAQYADLFVKHTQLFFAEGD